MYDYGHGDTVRHDSDAVQLGHYGRSKPAMWTAYRDALKARKHFQAHNVEGIPAPLPLHRTTNLKPVRGSLRAPAGSDRGASLDHADYVVFSYDTPIAWHDAERDAWVIPDVRYSVTTSKHQGTIRTAVSQLGEAEVDL